MTVRAVEHEQGRFFVESRSRAEILHLVDLDYRDEPWNKPHAACSCEEYQCKGNVCGHILRAVAHERERLGI